MKTPLKFLWIGFFLFSMLLPSAVEVAGLFHHFSEHMSDHTTETVHNLSEHKDCQHEHEDHLFASVDIHSTCHGHFLTTVPHLSTKSNVAVEVPFLSFFGRQNLFLEAQQYSSSYQHLFTSRPPPTFVA